MKCWDQIPWSSFLGMLSFKPAFSLSSFMFIKRLFSSFLLFATRVVSSAYLTLLIFLQAILIPTCDSSSVAFCMMYSAQKLNKQSDNIQPWCTPLPILNHSVIPCLVLTVASSPAYRFLSRQVRWTGIPVSLRIFHSLLWSTQSKALAQSMKQKYMFFWNSLAFSMNQWMLAIWPLFTLPFLNPACTSVRFSIHILLKPSLKDFEYNLASMWNECNCMLVWTFFGIFLLWDWNENWPYYVFYFHIYNHLY